MFYLKSKYLLVPPSSSDYKLIYPLNLKKFRYDRSNFSDQKVDEKISQETFDHLIDEIERDVLFFRRLIVYKLISIFSLVSMFLLIIIGTVIIVLDAVRNKQKTVSEFSNLTGDPNNHLLDNKGDEFSTLTIIGIVVLTFGALQFIVMLIVISVLSSKTFRKYKLKIAKILEKYNKTVFKNNEIKMLQGENDMWLEMRLDYKYNAYIAQHHNGQTSWDHIAALNNEIIKIPETNVVQKNLLGKKMDTQ